MVDADHVRRAGIAESAFLSLLAFASTRQSRVQGNHLRIIIVLLHIAHIQAPISWLVYGLKSRHGVEVVVVTLCQHVNGCLGDVAVGVGVRPVDVSSAARVVETLKWSVLDREIICHPLTFWLPGRP